MRDGIRPGGQDVACNACGAKVHRRFVDLGKSPLCERFIRADMVDEMEPFFPLNTLVCDVCHLVQLREYVTPDFIFTEDYPYYSSYSTSWVAHAKAYCEMMKARMGLGGDSLVVEVASNDGYLLQHFVAMGVPVLGIEPTKNTASAAMEKGVPTRVAFFNQTTARAMREEGLEADLMLGNNVLAHVPNINDFVAGFAIVLKPEGLLTFEFPHLVRLIEQTQFDTIYHEHFSYLSLITVDRLVRRHGLRVVDVQELPTHGGSLRVFCAREESTHVRSSAVDALIAREVAFGITTAALYESFTPKVERVKRNILRFLIDAKEAGQRVIGYGAPGKGNTLLNYCGIRTDLLEFTVDRNPHKHGMFTPGTHIPIKPVEALNEARPDFVWIMPWNLRDEISAQMRHIGDWGGRFVVAIPELEIFSPAS